MKVTGGSSDNKFIKKRVSSLSASDKRTFAVPVLQSVAVARLFLVTLVRGPAASKSHRINRIRLALEIVACSHGRALLGRRSVYTRKFSVNINSFTF